MRMAITEEDFVRLYESTLMTRRTFPDFSKVLLPFKVVPAGCLEVLDEKILKSKNYWIFGFCLQCNGKETTK